MARKLKPHDDHATEFAPYDSSTPSPMQVSSPLGDEIPLVNPSPHIGDATERERLIAEVMSPPKFQLVQGGVFTVRGLRTMLKAGKVVDAGNYDLASLRAQGAVLQAVG